MILKWKDVPGMLLTEEAYHNGFKYQLFWGFYYEEWNARIYEGEKIIDHYSSGNPNYGKQHCIHFCEKHAQARDMKGIITSFKYLWGESIQLLKRGCQS